MKILSFFLILPIKFYRYFVSPHFPCSCRYFPTCSEYFIDCIKINGPIEGFALGIIRILKCHPIKLFGGGKGFDPVPNLKKGKR